MLLQRLKEYEELQGDLSAPPLYGKTPIAYVVELKGDGTPQVRTLTPLLDPANARSRRGLSLLAPEIVRSSDVKPLLLADKSDYVFGIGDEGKPTRTQQAHESFRELLDECAASTEEPAVLAVKRFYEHGGKDRLEFPDPFDAAGKVTFRVHLPDGAVFPMDLPSVRQFWALRNDPGAGGGSIMQCLVCGLQRPVLERLQAKVKGVRGGQKAGTSLVSANEKAFESYGLAASFTAPTCAACGEGFTRGLNRLIAGDDTHLYVAQSTFVFWSRSGWSPAAFMSEPGPDLVRQLLESPRTRSSGAVTVAEEEGDGFYAVSLSGSGGRTVVRDWIDSTVEEVRTNLARWFSNQEVVNWDGSEGRPLGLWSLAASMVRKLDDLPAPVAPALFRTALAGMPLPRAILDAAVRRARAERRVTHARAALIKLVLLSTSEIPQEREDFMVALDPQHPEVAYHCGRLLAVLEKIQRRAQPGVTNTIVDRYFGTASSAPAGVFGRLIRGAQPHLSVLENSNRAAYVSLQRELEEVLNQVPAFPLTLTLQRQGLFCLGYYHQRAWRVPSATVAAINSDN